MIGILLLIVALACYFNSKQRWFSYFLYVSLMLGYNGGFGLWTDKITGITNGDLAVVYTFLISIYLLDKGRFRLPRVSFIRQYKYLLVFLACSVIFSLTYYGFSFYGVLQGSRSYLLFFSLPILSQIKSAEYEKLMKAFLFITTITAILYILQVVVGHPLMPYGSINVADKGEYSIDPTIGLVRLVNSPALNTFFLTLSFVEPRYFGRKVNLFRVLFFVALMCTFGRTGIFSGLLTVGLAIYFTGKAGKLIKTILILGIMFLPFSNKISERFEKGDTGEDLQTVLNGGAATYENSGDGGTMTYRIAWVWERSEYLLNRPILEQIFGLGLITDSYPQLPYNFRLGVYNSNTGKAAQMGTPDSAYGNLITWWGFGGTIVYMAFVISMVIFFYRHRRDNPFATVCAALSLMSIVISFSSTGLSTPNNYIIYFIVLSSILREREKCYLAKT